MRKIVSVFIFTVLQVCVCTNLLAVDFDAYFHDRTLRIDYLRKGNAKGNTIAVSSFVSKSGTWAGSRVHLIDPFNYGSYRIVVKDAATGADTCGCSTRY